MPSFTLAPDPRFKVGNTIFCYRAGGGIVPAHPAPVTSAAVAADSTTTFEDLDFGTPYLAGKTVNGPFVSFATQPSASDLDGVSESALIRRCRWNGTAWTYDGVVTAIRPAFDGMLIWVGGGPSADPTPEGLNIAINGDEWHPSEAVD